MWTQAVIVVVLSVLLFCDHALVEAETTRTGFSFPSFPVEDGEVLTARDAMFNPSVFSYDLTSKTDYCGRILYKDKVRVLDKASGKVASFSTSFTFSFHSVPNSTWHCGEGMVFTLVANPNVTLEGSKRYLYCTFDSDIFNASSRVFAVRFDSSRESAPSLGYEKLSDGNIGVVIRDKAGKLTISQYNLCDADVTQCKFFCGVKGDFSAWIDYDSAGQTLEVRFRKGSLASGGKPVEPLIRVPDLRLEDVLDDEMYVGFNAKTYWSASAIPRSEIHRISSWHFNGSGIVLDPASSSPGVSQHDLRLKAGVIAATVFGSVLMGVFLGVIVFFVCKNCRGSLMEPDPVRSPSPTPSPPPIRNPQCEVLPVETTEAETTEPVALPHGIREYETKEEELRPLLNIREYTYQELRIFTKNFNASELLSRGGSGDVYKATPLSGEPLLAVKSIRHSDARARQWFQAELKSLSIIRHRNLLGLRGYCKEQGLFLVTDFMSNGSLDKWLHPNPDLEPTNWPMLAWGERRDILAGVALGLEYLHVGLGQCVLHRDIKPGNVMLDAHFNPYLGDFGLARLVDHHDAQKTTSLDGTLGYMAPELAVHGGKPSKETDVYAFGILVLEMVCARKPEGVNGGGLLDRVWSAYKAGEISGVVDPRLREQSEALESNELIQQSMKIVADTLHLGLLCCLLNSRGRPSMRQVNHWFTECRLGEVAGAVQLPPLPVQLPLLPAAQPDPDGQYDPCAVDTSSPPDFLTAGTSSLPASSNATPSNRSSIPSPIWTTTDFEHESDSSGRSRIQARPLSPPLDWK